MIIHSTGASTLRFLWRECAYSFPSTERALQFLSVFKGDPAVMASLRRLLGERDYLYLPARMTDDDVLKAVAALLGNGELLAGVEWKDRINAPAKEDEAAAPAGSAGREPAAEEPESNTFGSDHDAAAQAGALTAAAQSGVPFCEECERARAQEGARQ